MTSPTPAAARLLLHGAVGQRWVVRFALFEDDDAAHSANSLSDALGIITALSHDSVSIETRKGVVSVDMAAVRLAKPVPPPPQRRNNALK